MPAMNEVFLTYSGLHTHLLWTELLFVPRCFICFTVLTAEVTAPHYLGSFCVPGVMQHLNPCQLLTMARCACERAHMHAAVGSMHVKNSSRLPPKLTAFSCSQLSASPVRVGVVRTMHAQRFSLWPKISRMVWTGSWKVTFLLISGCLSVKHYIWRKEK